MNTSKFLFKDKLLYWIVILLGFQQFPILRLGGSLKTYEILGFILLFSNLIKFKIKKATNYVAILSFVFFVVVPVSSYIYSSLFYDYPDNYYVVFPKAQLEFKSNYYIFPLLQILYMMMNWHVFVGLVNSKIIYENIEKVMKIAVILGTIISLYSFCALYVIDFIPMLPNWIQFKFTKEGTRSTGLSQEPGTYVLYQLWICFFLWYSKSSFTKKRWYILFLINVVSCALTQSTALWGVVIAILASFLIFKTTKSARRKTTFGLFFAIVITFTIVQLVGYGNTFYNAFFKKGASFFTISENHRALNSGALRKYTADIGYKIFEHYRLMGVGYGRSIYYMYVYKKQVGISYASEPINAGSVPLSMTSIIAAEMGLAGLIAFVLFYCSVFWTFWKNRNKSPLHKMFLLGCITEAFTFFSLYTPHAVFLWAYLGLGLGYVKFFDKSKSLVNKKPLLIEHAYT